MRNIFIAVTAITLISITAISSRAYAQSGYIPQICTPDCADDGWSAGPQLHMPMLGNDCPIVVTWVFRTNGCVIPWTYDIQILDVYYDVGYNCPPLTVPFIDILKMAYEKIIKEYMTQYPPTENGQCSDSYRIVQANCWHSESQYPRWYPCGNNDACCMELYRVCKVNGARTITKLSPPTLLFPPCPPDGNNGTCDNMCAVFDKIGDDTPPHGGGNTKPSTSQAIVSTSMTVSTVVPNPALESIDVIFTARKTGTATLKVYNSAGDQAITVTKSIDRLGEQRFTTNVHSFANGTYHYEIIVDGNIETKGAFVVTQH